MIASSASMSSIAKVNKFRKLKIMVAVGSAFGAFIYGLSYVWPAYDWATRFSSPNGINDVVVLRSNAAAFADFGYAVYVFPHALTPADRPKGTRVLFTPIWRSDKYRVFYGYSYPMLRWTDDNSLEINLDEAYYEKISFDPVKKFSSSDKPILISLVFKRDGDQYKKP